MWWVYELNEIVYSFTKYFFNAYSVLDGGDIAVSRQTWSLGLLTVFPGAQGREKRI